MSKGTIQVICGNGQGKTAAAVGWALTRTEHEKNIIMIQFLKGNQTGRFHLLKRLEPEMRIFSFERREECFGSLTPEEPSWEKGGDGQYPERPELCQEGDGNGGVRRSDFG